jgi:predicted nucleic acid-binding protein
MKSYMVHVLVDTNVLVALYNSEDSLHGKARALITETSTFSVLDIVVLETLTVLTSRSGFAVAVECLQYLTETDGITIVASSPHMHDYFNYFARLASPKLSLIDVALLAHATDMHVVTYDKDLQKEITSAKRNRFKLFK